jgi:hypothetical protein
MDHRAVLYRMDSRKRLGYLAQYQHYLNYQSRKSLGNWSWSFHGNRRKLDPVPQRIGVHINPT